MGDVTENYSETVAFKRNMESVYIFEILKWLITIEISDGRWVPNEHKITYLANKMTILIANCNFNFH